MLLILILGPTGTGKSAVAIELARLLNGEIVSADSRAIYKGMDIGTAKPPKDIRQKIKHHLLDIKEPEEHYDVMQFREDVKMVLKDILNRSKYPIVVGGSTLYVAAITDKLFDGPAADWKLRAKLKAQTLMELYKRLKEVDPKAAERIHPHDEQRIIRALEVYELSGIPISELQERPQEQFPYKFFKVGLRMERELLYKKIDERVDQMIAAGLIEEAKRLKARLKPHMQAYKTTGYQELFQYLDGQISLEAAIAEIKKNTRNLAKRQLIWFKRDPEINWLDVTGKTPVEVAEDILALIKCPRSFKASYSVRC